jgi:CheY-like chemotaxis protein
MGSQSGLNLKGKKLLIVEDNFISAQLYKGMLEDTEIEITYALTTKSAIEIIRNSGKFDVVLLDIQLPDMNGLEAAKVIKVKSPTTPIIVQTAFAFDNYKAKSKEVGCDYFLSKPINYNDLIDIFFKIFKDHRL